MSKSEDKKASEGPGGPGDRPPYNSSHHEEAAPSLNQGPREDQNHPQSAGTAARQELQSLLLGTRADAFATSIQVPPFQGIGQAPLASDFVHALPIGPTDGSAPANPPAINTTLMPSQVDVSNLGLHQLASNEGSQFPGLNEAGTATDNRQPQISDPRAPASRVNFQAPDQRLGTMTAWDSSITSSSNTGDGSVDINQLINEGATIVPCKARGMPSDHNAQNAYLILRKDVKHGDGLLCSHIQCQNKGIRFVYCKVCDQPVAKYNFTTRHKHLDVLEPDETAKAGAYRKRDAEEIHKAEFGEDPKPKSGGPNGDASDEERNASKIRKKTHGKDVKTSKSNVNQSASKTASPDSNSTNDGLSTSEERKDKTSSSPSDPSDPRSSSMSSSGQQDSLASVEKEWLTLLMQRPKSKKRKKMKTWMRRILVTSEYIVASRKQRSDGSSSDDRSSSADGSLGSDSASGSLFSNLVGESLSVVKGIHTEIAAGKAAIPPAEFGDGKGGSSSSSSSDSHQPTKTENGQFSSGHTTAEDELRRNIA